MFGDWIISELTGKDLAFRGGGFHQSGNGGYLDTHVDFNMHPEHPDWLRTLNILLYLNEDWRPEYDGRLLLRTDPEGEPLGIEPAFNRGVFMLTGDHTFHGFDKMTLPNGVTRKSIATYANEKVPVGSVRQDHRMGAHRRWCGEAAGREALQHAGQSEDQVLRHRDLQQTVMIGLVRRLLCFQVRCG